MQSVSDGIRPTRAPLTMDDIIGTMLRVLSTSSAPSLDRLLDETIRTLATEIAGPSGCIWLTDERAPGSCVHLEYDHNDIDYSTTSPPVWLTNRTSALVSPWACEDVGHERSLAGQRSDLLERRIKSMVLVPLTSNNHVVATCVLGGRTRRRYSPSEIGLARDLAYPLALVIQLSRRQREYSSAAVRKQRMLLQSRIEEEIKRFAGMSTDGSHQRAPSESTATPESSQPDQPPAGGVPLTARERQVLTHIARGLTNRQIAVALGISEGTVRTHVSRVLQKLGVESRIHALKKTLEPEQKPDGSVTAPTPKGPSPPAS